MELNELKTILNTANNISGIFTEDDIDYFINGNLADEHHCEYVKVNGAIIPFRRICLGMQKLSKHLEETYLLFIYDFKQVQIQIKDITSIEFDPEFKIY